MRLGLAAGLTIGLAAGYSGGGGGAGDGGTAENTQKVLVALERVMNFSAVRDVV